VTGNRWLVMLMAVCCCRVAPATVVASLQPSPLTLLTPGTSWTSTLCISEDILSKASKLKCGESDENRAWG